MKNDNSGAKDFFLHLGLIVSLYVGVIALVNLLFRIINTAFPKVESYYRYYSNGSPISMPIATLIVAVPLFLFLSSLVYKSFKENPEKKDLRVRKWLLYITLFVAGIIFAGDLITIIYYFLDGRELTAGFLLKVLVMFLTSISVFIYYIRDLQDRHNEKSRKVWASVSVIVVLLAIILGFSVIGSPRTQRLMRYDNQRISALESIQYDVQNYYRESAKLPKDLDELYQSAVAYTRPVLTDPETNEVYAYKAVGQNTFELCATFNLPSDTKTTNAQWAHAEGLSCFTRTATGYFEKPIPLPLPIER